MTNLTPGWYPDPTDPMKQRLWDGEQWTQLKRPLSPPEPAVAQTPGSVATPARRARQPKGQVVAPNFIAKHRKLTIIIGAFIVLTIMIGVVADRSTKAVSSHIGIGSTISQMVSAHSADQGPGDVCAAANSCFGRTVTNDESGKTYQFTGALTGSGLIEYYQQNFTKGTTAASAVAQVLKYLPKDARAGPIVVGHNGANSCGLLNITSPTLARIFTQAGQTASGHPAGELGIVLQYVNSNLTIVYDLSNVEEALVTPVSINMTANPSC